MVAMQIAQRDVCSEYLVNGQNDRPFDTWKDKANTHEDCPLLSAL